MMRMDHLFFLSKAHLNLLIIPNILYSYLTYLAKDTRHNRKVAPIIWRHLINALT